MSYRNSRTPLAALCMLAAASALTVAAMATLGPTSASATKMGVRHLYVYEADGKTLVTYSTVASPVTGVDVATMSVAPHPTVVDSDGRACSSIELTPQAGQTAHLVWRDASAEEKDFVFSGQRFVLCVKQLPNHDQLQYPPD